MFNLDEQQTAMQLCVEIIKADDDHTSSQYRHEQGLLSQKRAYLVAG